VCAAKKAQNVERVKGIEPSYEAWEAAVLPLNYTRVRLCILAARALGETAFGATIAPLMTDPRHRLRQTSEADAQRPIRSFVVRAGRSGSGQQRALLELGPRFVLPFSNTPFQAEAAFGRNAPLVLEIGFGMGQATAAVAAAQPLVNFLGVEVHPPGVGALLKLIGEQDLHNLRIVQHDAVEVLQQMLAPNSLAGIHIWFPDPWHKKRHHKRRLIQPELVALLTSRLAPGGVLHCATDWQPYAEQMLAVLSANADLANTVPERVQVRVQDTTKHSGYAPRPDSRPLTKFEQRGQRLGHGVWDLLFTRR
jgi:tRNA (guanine-N7-)-methyltransferase